jgi:hypothetical protein
MLASIWLNHELPMSDEKDNERDLLSPRAQSIALLCPSRTLSRFGRPRGRLLL